MLNRDQLNTSLLLLLYFTDGNIVAVLNLVLTRHDSAMRKVMFGLISELTLAQDNGHKSLESGDVEDGSTSGAPVEHQWSSAQDVEVSIVTIMVIIWSGECQVS